MSAQNRFAELAAKAMETSEGFVNAIQELTSEQNKVVKLYTEGKKSLEAKITATNDGHNAQIKTLEDLRDEKIAKVRQEMKNLKTEFETECVAIGLKKENIPLTEYRVVQTADKAATKILNGIGSAKRYIANRIG